MRKYLDILESPNPAEALVRELKSMGREWLRPGDDKKMVLIGSTAIHIEVYDRHSINLMEINTGKTHRFTGAGSAALKVLTDLADRHKVTIYGNAYPIITMLGERRLKLDELVGWYQKNGFEIADEPAVRGVNIVRHPR